MLQDNIKIDDLIIKQDNAFTLAEVLVTLTIIGVVASLTVPSLVVKTKQEQYKTSAKKAYANFMQALTLAEIQTRTSHRKVAEEGYGSEKMINFVTALISNFNATKTVTISDTHRVIYTPDGMSWHYNPNYLSYFFVDVNGDKGPTDANNNPTPVTNENWDDFKDTNWPNVELNDVFVIQSDGDGSFQITPNYYSYYAFQQ